MSPITTKSIITTSNAPRPIAPFSQAIGVDNLLFTSGVIGMDKDSMKLVEGGIAAETKKALENLHHVLKAGNSSFEKVIKVTVLLKDMKHFDTVNEIYKLYFTKFHPARTAYQVAKLPMGALIEIEAISCKGEIQILSKL